MTQPDVAGRQTIGIELDNIAASDSKLTTRSVPSTVALPATQSLEMEDEKAQFEDATAGGPFTASPTPTPPPPPPRSQPRGGPLTKLFNRHYVNGQWADTMTPVPEGGFVGWFQVLIGHLTNTCTWGFINAFGVFQTHYTEAFAADGVTSSDVAWIGSLQAFFLFMVSVLSGRLTDAGWIYEVWIVGWSLQLFGVFTLSFATTFWQVLLAQGVCMGIANGLLFVPSLSLIASYFSKRRGLAMGIAGAGSSTGGVVFSVIFRQLLPTVGFGWACRCMGFVVLACAGVCLGGTRVRLFPRKGGPVLDLAAFKEPPYAILSVALGMIYLGVYFVFFYIGLFSRQIIGFSVQESASLLLVVNAPGFLGRVLPNYVSDRYTGPINVLTFSSGTTALLTLCWIGVDSRAGLYVLAIFVGFFASSIHSIVAVAVASLTDDLQKVGTRMGMVFAISGVAALVGTPVAGQIVNNTPGGKFWGAQVFSGGCVAIGTLLCFVARTAKVGWGIRKRA